MSVRVTPPHRKYLHFLSSRRTVISGSAKFQAKPALLRCSRLMALGVSLTVLAAGAETIEVSADSTYGHDILAEDDTISIDNSGTIINNKIVLKGGSITNIGTIDTNTLWLETSSSSFGGTVIS